MSTGPATSEQLHELHRALVAELLDRLKGTPSAELLGVTRALLRQEGVHVLDMTSRERKKLEALYRLLADRLLEALAEERPPAAVLAEVRQFVASQGIGKNLAAGVDTAAALRALKSSDLPFH